MHRMTKKLLFVLITIVAYLPMAIAYSVPDVSVSEQTQSMADMDMSNCHDQQTSKKCGHCTDQHNCNAAHSSCSTSFGISSQSYDLNINQKVKSGYSTFRVGIQFQQPIHLFRPPISL
jgi:hypothetical protein